MASPPGVARIRGVHVLSLARARAGHIPRVAYRGTRVPSFLSFLLPPPSPLTLRAAAARRGGRRRSHTARGGTYQRRQSRVRRAGAIAGGGRARRAAQCATKGSPPPPRGARRTRAYVSEWASGRLAAIKPVPDGVFLPRRRAREKDGAGASNGVLRRAPRACRWLACVNVILRPRLRARLWICGFQL